MSTKIIVIGAGSAVFSGNLVRDLALTKGLHGSQVVLIDLDADRLQMIGRLAERISDELDANLRIVTATDRTKALDGADFVVNTAQVGGHDWTNQQTQIAQRHGTYRGVSLHNYGQAAFFLQVAHEMEKHCPNAWLIQSANPVFEGCTLIHRESSMKCIGLCHGHLGYRKIAKTLGLNLEHVHAETHGVNHCVWMTDFRYKGQDAYPLLDRWIEEEAEAWWVENHDRDYKDLHLSRAAVHQYKLFGLMGIGDTPRFAGWWYNDSLRTKQFWYTADGGFDSELGWRKYLIRNQDRIDQIAQAASDESTPVLETFKPRMSNEQIVPIIDAMVHDRPGKFQVNVPNRGRVVRDLPEDLVVEVPAMVDADGVHPIAVPDLPAKVMTGILAPRWQACEMIVNAIRQRDKDFILHRLLNWNHVPSLARAEAMINEWLMHPQNQAMRDLFGSKLYETNHTLPTDQSAKALV